MKLKTILYAAAAMLLAACSNDDAETAARVPLTVKATVLGAETRLSSNNDGSESFEKGDVIYVSKVVNGNISRANGYMNIKYVFDGEKFAPENSSNTYYFDPNGDDVVFAASNIDMNSDIIVYEPSNDDQTKSLHKDVFYASTTCNVRNPEATFKMTHLMSKVTIKFSSVVSSCSLSGDGVFYDAVRRVGYYEPLTNGIAIKCHLTSTSTSTTAEALIYPCSTAAVINIEVVSNSKTYKGTIPSTSLEANHHYIYNIRINDKLTVESGTIVTGFTDSNTIFTGEESDSDQDVDHDDL
jgi:hypothetical protein